jgi:hypothetical protein
MKRREFIRLLGGTATLSPLFLPFVARAQAPAATTPPVAGQTNASAAPVGQVATVEGTATATRRNAAPVALHVGDPVYANDALATAANSTLGVTFDDQTTFSLSASTRIVINAFVYEEGGGANAATFNVAVGTAAFVASLVAKTGDMKIATPNATLGIRGTTGVVDIPENGGAGTEPKIKLYPDNNGHVGRIEVFNPQGGRLGELTQGGSAFAIQRGPGGAFRAVPFHIPPQEAARDRGVLQRLRESHNIGRRMTRERLHSRGGHFGPNTGRQGGRGQPFNSHGGGAPRGQPHRGNPGGRRRN